ncbi:WG repeat-containing protein [Chitinophaga sp.]|uniref:WG repeat-containing protein n=1 Tax=Chitinophaga sp. TaxID=1869181 RepID=UPI002F94593C
MTFTIRITLIALVMIAGSACKSKQPPSAEVLAFVKTFDGKTLTEAREMLHAESERVSSFIDFMKSFDKESPKSFKPEEEEFDKPFQLTPATEYAAKYAAYFEGIGFQQSMEVPNSTVATDGPFRSNSDFSGLDAPDFTTTKIFFHDGSIDTKPYAIDASTTIPGVKTMDSILADVRYSYPVKISVLTLDEQHDKLTYKGAEIKIDKMGDNRVRLLMGDSAFRDYIHVEALNKDGKPLDYTGRNSGVNSPDDMNRLLVNFSKTLKGLISKLDKGRFKDIDALQKEIAAEMPDGSPFDEGHNGYTEGYYKGNVVKVKVYMADVHHIETTQLTLKNLEPNYAGLFLTKDGKSGNYGFTDGSGAFVIPATYKKLSQLNPYFFANEDYNGYYYYRLDTGRRQLVKVDYVVKELTSQLATVNKEGAANAMGVMDGNGNMIIPMGYDDIYLDPVEPILFANKTDADKPYEGINTLYTCSGQLLSPDSYYTAGGTFHSGLLLVIDHARKIYFIDNKGKKAIDLNGYVDAEPFSDGLARVRVTDGKYGFINTSGKLVIPCIYTDASTTFSEGIAMVRRDNKGDAESGLINTKNETVLPFRKASSTYESGAGVKREYTIDGIKYNAKGEEIKE